MDPSVAILDEQPPQYEASPSNSEQYDIIQPLVNSPLQVGETRYLVDFKWYEEWQRFATQKSSTSPGPIDNTSLFNDSSFTTLKGWLSIDIDIVPVPEEAWEKLILWYGSLTPEIIRPVIKNSAQEAIVEVYPWEVSLVRILPPSSSMLSKKALKLQISKGCTISDLRFKVIDTMEIETEMKLWKFGEDVPETAYIKADQLENAQPIEAKFDSKTIQEFGLHLYDAIGVEIKDNGKWPTGYVPQPVVTSSNGVSNNTPVYSVSAYTPRTAHQSSKPHGVTGLSNLGNTCFMNSALQCLSNTKELKEYFFSGMYKHELNKTNPLGMNGEVAEAFGNLIERLWNGLNSSIAPREFKLTIGRFAPSFMGYQQHDSQEFIAFLLDGLHEDLNRIYDKPYIEKKDSEGRPDAIVAEEHWQIHKSRNDSVIVDMFQGQYKSTLICPECNKVSVTFDPFMYLTLPIPVSKELKLEVHFVPLDPARRPLKLNLKMPHGSTHKAMKEKIGSMLNVIPENIVTCEVYTSRIYKVFENSEKLNEIGVSDTIYAYELPVAFPPNRGSGCVILSVLNTYSKQIATSSFGTSRTIPDFFGVPLLVTLSDEKISEEGLEEAVLEQLGRYTTVDLKSLTPADLISVKREDSVNDVEMDDVEIKQRVEEINDEELVTREDDVAPLEESDSETPVKKFKKADPKLFEMKISSQSSGRGIPANFTLTNFISLSKRRQDVDEAKEVTQLPFLKLGDTIICEWEREIADYVFDDSRNEMDTDDVKGGLWNTFEIFVDPNENPIEKSQEKKNITLDDCLEEFVKEEQLGEEDPWYCPNCKKHQQALKKFDLWRLPDFLVVHLKRFSHTRSWRNKIDVLVDFPVNNLDLSSRVLGESIEENGMIYDLYAISNHYGGLGGGHYTAYAYNYEDERWYHYDDSMVEPVDVDSIKTTAAYLLFYKRRGAKFQLPDLSQIQRQTEQQTTTNGGVDQMQLTPFNPSVGNSDHIEYSDEELDKDMEISMSDGRSSPDFM